MSKHPFHTIITLAVAFSMSGVQAGPLFLLTGSPNPKGFNQFQSAILALDPESKEVRVKSQISAGTFMIEFALEYRKALIVAPSLARVPENLVLTLDLDSAAIVKRCDWQRPTERHIFDWLADLPGAGLSLVSYYARHASGTDSPEYRLRSSSLDPQQPCASGGKEGIHPNDVGLPMLSGQASVGGIAPQEGFSIVADKQGRISSSFRQGTGPAPWIRVYYSPIIGPEILKEVPQPSVSLKVNNRTMTVFTVGDSNIHWLGVYRKRDSSWRYLPIPDGGWPAVRGFGKYLVTVEGWKKTGHNTRESAGKSAWRRTESKYGRNIAEELDRSPYAYPGVLHVYDIDSELTYTIETGQADSEVVLIDEADVYYRVSDQLMVGRIKGKGIEDRHVIATSELFRDAHWAWLGK